MLQSVRKAMPFLMVSIYRPVISKLYSTTHLSTHLTLRHATSGNEDQRNQTKPMVLFFPWLRAPKKALDKYCDLYHSRGWDVLTVHGELKHFLWPSKSQTMARELCNFLTSSEDFTERPSILVHSLSVGAFLYTVLLMEAKTNPKTLEYMQDKICGQIYDSVVIGGLQRMATGIAKSTTANTFLQKSIISSANAYFAVTKPWTVRFYNESMDTVYNTPLQAPILVFHSLNDPMSSPEAMNDLVQYWRQKQNIDVEEKYWTKSKHAAHLREHQQEYCEIHNSFLSKTL